MRDGDERVPRDATASDYRQAATEGSTTPSTIIEKEKRLFLKLAGEGDCFSFATVKFRTQQMCKFIVLEVLTANPSHMRNGR